MCFPNDLILRYISAKFMILRLHFYSNRYKKIIYILISEKICWAKEEK